MPFLPGVEDSGVQDTKELSSPQLLLLLPPHLISSVSGKAVGL